MRVLVPSVVAAALLCVARWAPLPAQRVAATGFADLRADGNGVAELSTTIENGFRGTTSAAFTSLARVANLNLTFDPLLPGLGHIVAIGAHRRSAAVALLEVADASHVLVRVSPTGQIVVVAARENVAPRVTASDSVPPPVALPAVRSEAARFERDQFALNANVGTLSLAAQELRSMPSFVEPDVLRSIQTMPGIETRSDWSAGFNVRGGEADQSLILLDGYPIYNPFHLGGMFSTFIDPTVGRVDLREGGMPARYGDRLSGVLDVRSAEAADTALRTTLEVSLLSTTASTGRAFADGSGSWIIGARRTYLDAVLALAHRRDLFPYHFQDLQGHLSRTMKGLRVSITAYNGEDVGEGATQTIGNGGWGNQVLGTTVSKALVRPRRLLPLLSSADPDSVVVEQHASLTRFDAHIDVPGYQYHASNGVRDLREGGSMSLFGGSATTTLGYEIAGQRTAYDALSASQSLSDLIPVESTGASLTSLSAYADQRWRPWSSVLVETGERVDALSTPTWVGFSPRVAIKYFLSNDVALTLGGGRYAQWMHSLGREEEPVQPMQLWVGTGASMPVSRATDASAGLESWLTPSRLLHVEAFFKHYDSLLEPNTASDPRVAGDEFLPTNGFSYGLDFLIRQLGSGPFSGWLSYSYAMNDRVGSDGRHYYPTQDRRHTLNAVGSWRTDDGVTYGLRVAVASGLPTTDVTGQFLRERYDPVNQRWIPDAGLNTAQNIAGEFNASRLPWYTRTDASVSRPMRLFGREMTLYASIMNVFNAHNPAGYVYSYTGRSDRASFPNLPFAPTLGFRSAF